MTLGNRTAELRYSTRLLQAVLSAGGGPRAAGTLLC
jgi:hypothetical protein